MTDSQGSSMRDAEEREAQTELYTFIGSGGVGKTTLSAAWALSLAQRGSKVALITIDPAKRLAQSLGLDGLEGALKQTTIHQNLWAMMLDQEQTSLRLVQRFAATPERAHKIAQNRYFKTFSRSLAGTQEMMAVYEVYEALASERFDVVVLDTPPAQHALDFLDVPQRLGVALDGPALRWLLDHEAASGSESTQTAQSSGWRAKLGGIGKSVALRAFTKMTSAPFIEDLFEFLSLFGGVLSALRARGGSLEELLRSPASHMCIVSAPQPSTLSASDQVTRALSERGYRADLWLVNRVPTLWMRARRQSLSLAELSRSGLAELEASLADLDNATLDQAISEWHREIQRAQRAADALTRCEHSPARLELLEELPLDLSPSERLRELAAQLSSVTLKRVQ